MPATDERRARPRLSRDRVLQAAVSLADANGIEALSMRRLGEQLGVEAMSLYRHVASKDDLLDAMVRETDTRYLIVTHNAVTMSRMHRLFGVTMVEKGVSRLVSVDLGGAEELLAAE